MRLLIPLLLLFANSVFAADARARLEAFANRLDVLSGEFTQTTSDANGSVQEASQGTLALAAPRQFRWQYEDPFPQLIVADGNNVWIYDEDLEQVTVRNQSTEESQSPLTLLVDLSQLDRDYVVHNLKDRDSLSWLAMVARAEEQSFKRIEIGFDANGPKRMLLEDLLGNRTEWIFSNWQRNPTLAADTFKFTPPEGVDVIGEATAGAEAIPLQ
ncbi:MAG: outer membrane lipoprotein chaperone LolA [Rhodanobacteraceae bacterium]|jgi:outer membrane lipoprotein carrier protein|nr:outer membrane lipoprotein chaperone LolA [Rhodanobacteraceae bacterium]MBK7042605.1 outer membrane lipoprotein chaperone LolA [Rhodanobacteraceae bacterium]MBP9153477.1 outer membrane lipoprotein chaperone LolA [Xanthomonadales bacterium]HQW82701.1 outer membrane lipoprotein chaperone LolA [Pseudomonadota bacterium]